MTNPHTPAPRPCTLWGETAALKHNSIYSIVFENERLKLVEWNVGEMHSHPYYQFDGYRFFSDVISTKVYEHSSDYEYSDFIGDLQEMKKSAEDTLYQAVHPPLCMKHAVEIGYEFDLKKNYAYDHTYPNGWECMKTVTGGYLKALHDKEDPIDLMDSAKPIQWFYPVNALGQPTHGDAERFVNAWEGK